MQDFVPVPLTLSTAMFVSEQDTDGKKIHIPKGRREKRLQAALMQYWLPRNNKIIASFLRENRLNRLMKQIKNLKIINRPAKSKPPAAWDI